MKGWQAQQLVDVCRLPQRPSDVLEMRQAGYGPKARLAFDAAVIGFVTQFERMRDETVERPAPETRDHRPTVLAPRYSREELLEFLGLPVRGDRADAAYGMEWAPVSESDWSTVWGEDEERG